MAEHPILLICRALPTKEEELTNAFLDKMHLIFSAANIHHSKDRCECFKIVTEVLPELGLLSWVQGSDKKIVIKPGINTKEVIKYYGN